MSRAASAVSNALCQMLSSRRARATMTNQAQLNKQQLHIHQIRKQLSATHASLIRMSSLRAEIIRIVSVAAEGVPIASTREARDESSQLLDRATKSVLKAWRELDHLQRVMVFDAEKDDSEHDPTNDSK